MRDFMRSLLLERQGVYLDEGLKASVFSTVHGELKSVFMDAFRVGSDALEMDDKIQRGMKYLSVKTVDEFIDAVAVYYLCVVSSMSPNISKQLTTNIDNVRDRASNGKYSVWLFARLRSLIKAYNNGSALYDKVYDENLGIFPDFGSMLFVWTPNWEAQLKISMNKAHDILSKLSGIEIGKYKSFSELLAVSSIGDLDRRRADYIGLGDISGANKLVLLGDADADYVVKVDSNDLREELTSSDYLRYKDEILSSLGQDVLDGYIEWLVEPKYFAVVICSYKGAKGHGDGSDWCTRFGAESKHIDSYFERGPLFVVYANKDFKTPGGVHRGIEVEGFRRICQVSCDREGNLTEVKDINNDEIDDDSMVDMVLSLFIFALGNNSYVRGTIDGWEMPEKNVYNDIVVEDAWGVSWDFLRDGSIDSESDTYIYKYEFDGGGSFDTVYNTLFREYWRFFDLDQYNDLIADSNHLHRVKSTNAGDDRYVLSYDPDLSEEEVTHVLSLALLDGYNYLYPQSDTTVVVPYMVMFVGYDSGYCFPLDPLDMFQFVKENVGYRKPPIGIGIAFHDLNSIPADLKKHVSKGVYSYSSKGVFSTSRDAISSILSNNDDVYVFQLFGFDDIEFLPSYNRVSSALSDMTKLSAYVKQVYWSSMTNKEWYETVFLPAVQHVSELSKSSPDMTPVDFVDLPTEYTGDALGGGETHHKGRVSSLVDMSISNARRVYGETFDDVVASASGQLRVRKR